MCASMARSNAENAVRSGGGARGRRWNPAAVAVRSFQPQRRVGIKFHEQIERRGRVRDGPVQPMVRRLVWAADDLVFEVLKTAPPAAG